VRILAEGVWLLIISEAFARASSLMSAREMAAPELARSWAVARPMPEAPPVTA